MKSDNQPTSSTLVEPMANGGGSDIVSSLAKILPDGLALELFHLATPAVSTKPLFSAPPGQTPEPTTKESHFIAVAHESVLVFAIEIVVYLSSKSQRVTIFVSKADSSGHLPPRLAAFSPVDQPDTRVSLLKTLSTHAVSFILNGFQQSFPTSAITVSLFARSQSQYLFPNSGSNKHKHVLSDQGLIRWWCKVLDPVVQQHAPKGGQAYVLVPGSDRFQVQKLFPTGKQVSWKHGHPFQLDPQQNVTVREVIPHFPDDPKARFLEELDGDAGDHKIPTRGHQWNNITTVDEFWELMSHRQECSLGRCVGFIWVVLPGETGKSTTSTRPPSDVTNSGPASSVLTLDPSIPSNVPLPRSPRKRPSSNALGLLSPRKKRTKHSDTVEPAVRNPPVIKGTVTLDDKRYQKAIDSLLNHSDFSSRDDAKLSSTKWIQGVSAMWGNLDSAVRWGATVKGHLSAHFLPDGKAQSPSGPSDQTMTQKETAKVVNVLSTGLIRKKKKPQ